MTAKPATKTIVRTEAADNGRSLDVTFCDRTGALTTIRLGADSAACLVNALNGLDCTSAAGPVPTKLPTRFAVGRGRFDPFVLVRFEHDAPYALGAEQAAELAQALLDEADYVAATYAAPMRQ